MSVRITNNVGAPTHSNLGEEEVCKLLRASLVKYFFAHCSGFSRISTKPLHPASHLKCHQYLGEE